MNESLFKYNEKIYAEEIIKRGFITNRKIKELQILSKYLKYKGMSIKEIEEYIINFCNKNISEFDYSIHFRMVNKVINYCKKPTNNLLIINSICVYQEEIEYVNNLDLSDIHKKVLFGLIIQNKINM